MSVCLSVVYISDQKLRSFRDKKYSFHAVQKGGLVEFEALTL